jgi:hypothetical protein
MEGIILKLYDLICILIYKETAKIKYELLLVSPSLALDVHLWTHKLDAFIDFISIPQFPLNL